MPWCPKCKRFQEEDDLCVYCWVETVENLEPEAQQESGFESSDVLLLTVCDETEANIVQSLLLENHIHSVRKHRGSGGYLQIYMGMSNLGIDIFVSEKDVKQAKQILENQKCVELSKEFQSDEDEEFLPENSQYVIRRRNRLLIILGIFFLLNVLTFIVLTLKFDISFGIVLCASAHSAVK